MYRVIQGKSPAYEIQAPRFYSGEDAYSLQLA